MAFSKIQHQTLEWEIRRPKFDKFDLINQSKDFKPTFKIVG